MNRLLVLLLLVWGTAHSQTELSDYQVRIEDCIYEIGQKSQENANWVCVTFNPVSVGDGPSLWDVAVDCQRSRPDGNHALHAHGGQFIHHGLGVRPELRIEAPVSHHRPVVEIDDHETG